MNNTLTQSQSLWLCLHYEIKEDLHTMDAFALNKSEAEVLSILQEIANTFQLPISIESEALREGSVKKFLKLKVSELTIKQHLLFVGLPALATLLLFNPAQKLIDRATDYVIDRIFEDKEVLRLKEQLEKTKLQVELNNYKQTLAKQIQQLDTHKIEKRVSNHYDQLRKCEEVEYFEFSSVDENQKNISSERIYRKDFENLILRSDDLESIVDDCAVIEIVAPVIKASSLYRAKWSGIYNGQPIRFYMLDKYYGRDIIEQQVHFQHGSVIKCSLEIKRKLTSEGEVNEYEHIVWEVFETNTMIPQGKSKRRKSKSTPMAITSDLFEGLYED